MYGPISRGSQFPLSGVRSNPPDSALQSLGLTAGLVNNMRPEQGPLEKSVGGGLQAVMGGAMTGAQLGGGWGAAAGGASMLALYLYDDED